MISNSKPSTIALTNIILPAIKLVGKQCNALSPGSSLKKSPVLIADLTIACLDNLTFFGIPVDPDVFTSIYSLESVQLSKKSPKTLS